ncbi:MAG TPA: T9SS type A sorting domain-containing protein [Flavobacteriales bacterium]|nr:T9SS type A sorting domain-containing protein [Flavobacteriales bacterium]HIN39437.1 T9SS type A sorting domain-containing protein [Flavobacteriales bacterium]
MKKTLLLSMCYLSLSICFGQTFSDDFESYTAGSYLVVQNPTDWDTWTGGSGTTEDVIVSDATSSSGNNSLYFASTGGGPEDIILRFDQIYSSGNFNLDCNFFVESGKGAYFNLQENFVVGDVWAINCFMLDNGTLKLSNASTSYLTTNYPIGKWFNLRLEIDLTANVWELFIDNVSQGTFANPTGSIGIFDLYPTNPTSEGGNDISGFYVDDVSYNHISANLPAVNGGVTFVSQLNGIAGQTASVDATVRNLGSDAITSFDIEYDYNGNQVQESVGPISLASLATYDHTFAVPVTLAAGSLPLTVTVSNVNAAGADANADDDAKSITMNPVVPATGKLVIGEEGTGTWCGWCPRGAVGLRDMDARYHGLFQGIAVHNGDIMTDAVYDAGIGALISGYPSGLVDRGPDIDPGAFEVDFLERIIIPPSAFMTVGATYNSSTKELNVSVSAAFQLEVTGNYKVACVIVEDSVTGTTSDYDQSNSYAGGGAGVMGGFELLPHPVPAAQMQYDHVARAISPSFEGLDDAYPDSISKSPYIITHNFSFVLDAGWDENQIHIVGMLIDPNGRIDNAGSVSIAEAETNGLVNGGVVVSTKQLPAPDETVKIYPNPASNAAFLKIQLKEEAHVSMQVFNSAGQLVLSRDYGNLNGSYTLPIITKSLNKGIYAIKLQHGDKIVTKKLVVNK